MVDGLKGFPEAITAVFPDTVVQTCIVHLIRYSMQFASWKERKAIAKELEADLRGRPAPRPPPQPSTRSRQAPGARSIHRSSPAGAATWEQVIPFFAFSPEVRRIIYTTNAIESLHMQLRKIIKTRGHFPSDEAATKLLWLAIRNVLAKAVRPAYDWKAAMNQFAVLFGERFTLARA